MDTKSALLSAVLAASQTWNAEEGPTYTCDPNHYLCPAITECLETTRLSYDQCLDKVIVNIQHCPWITPSDDIPT